MSNPNRFPYTGPVECSWCQSIANGSAQFGTGDWFPSCGKHGIIYEPTERWKANK